MRKHFVTCLFVVFYLVSFSQEDSIAYHQIIRDVNISAFRSSLKLKEIPANIEVIDAESIESYPVTNFDNILQSVANVYVNRSWGVFSKNSSVTMRGMDGTNRVLVLYDGVPLNKSAGGGINWHIISPWQVEKVEIIKGPQSAVYGNNSMAGIINIETRKPVNKFEGNAGLLFGSYGTYGGRVELGGNEIKENKGFYWTVGAFGRKSDGYINAVEDNPDSSAVKLFLEEFSSDIKLGYSFNSKTQLSVSGKYYRDHRGDGTRFYEPEGSYYDTQDKLLIADFKTEIFKTQLSIKGYYNSDDYYQHTERVTETGGLYKLYDVSQISNDAGLIMNVEHKFGKKIHLVTGYDFKTGNLNAQDIYRTSLDDITRYGALISSAVFAQVFWTIKPKLLLHAGFRYDYAKFFNSGLDVLNPSSETGFSGSFDEVFPVKKWNSVSPKISLKYTIKPQTSVFISFNQGYMPPKIDDLCSSRKINKGFKIANPSLLPETVLSYELGMNSVVFDKTKVEGSFYLTQGKDFQYFVATGDITEDDRIVYMRKNVAGVNIAGLELSLTQVISNIFYLKANYALNHTKITQFDGAENESLKGNELSEIPANQAYIGLFYKYKKLSLSLVFNYIGKQWADEINSAVLDPYYPVDASFSIDLYKGLQFSFVAQNLLNDKYIDKKGLRSPGLYAEGMLRFSF